MPVQHSDFAASAARYANESGEVDWRNACSRGYYAAYHASRIACEASSSSGHFKSAGYQHAALIKSLLHFPVGPAQTLARSVGYVMSEMRLRREIEDSNSKSQFRQTEAMQQLEMYKKLDAKVRTLP